MVKKKVNDEVLKRAHEKGLTLKEASDVTGLSPWGVSQRWRTMGLKPYGKRRPSKIERTVPAFLNLRPVIVRLIESLSRKLGINKSEVVSEAVRLLVEKYKYSRSQKKEK